MADWDKGCARTFVASFWGMVISAVIFPPLAFVLAWVCVGSLVVGLLRVYYDWAADRGRREAERAREQHEAVRSRSE